MLARAGVPMRTSLQRLQERACPGRRDRQCSRRKSPPASRSATPSPRPVFRPLNAISSPRANAARSSKSVFEHLAEFWTRQLHMLPGAHPVSFIIRSSCCTSPSSSARWSICAEGLPAVVDEPGADIWPGFYAAGFVLFVLIRVSWHSDAAQRFWLALPIIGNALSTAYAYRWITALRLEYSAGIPAARCRGRCLARLGLRGARAAGARRASAILREGGGAFRADAALAPASRATGSISSRRAKFPARSKPPSPISRPRRPAPGRSRSSA